MSNQPELMLHCYSSRKLRQWMDARGVDARKLARLSGRSYQTVRRAFDNPRSVSIASWAAFARSLEIDPVDLLPAGARPVNALPRAVPRKGGAIES